MSEALGKNIPVSWLDAARLFTEFCRTHVPMLGREILVNTFQTIPRCQREGQKFSRPFARRCLGDFSKINCFREFDSSIINLRNIFCFL